MGWLRFALVSISLFAFLVFVKYDIWIGYVIIPLAALILVMMFGIDLD